MDTRYRIINYEVMKDTQNCYETALLEIPLKSLPKYLWNL